MLTFNASLVNIWLPVLDLEPIQVLFINLDLTLTLDPATLTLIQIKALIDANLMCKSNQDTFPLLATTDPPKSHIDAY